MCTFMTDEEMEDCFVLRDSISDKNVIELFRHEIRDSVTFCYHEKKYINEAGGIKFWVCPVCKTDLGDA